MTRHPLIPVVFDATRLQSRLHLDAPTGIDRVDLAYLQAFESAHDLQLRLLVRGSLGLRLLTPAAAARLRERLHRWQARQSAAGPTAIDRALWQWLKSPPSADRATSGRESASGFGERIRHLLGAATGQGSRPSPATTGLPPLARTTVYVNTSHGQLYRADYDRWLRQPGLRSLFFVHDLIPLRHPEFSRAAEPARHAARLAMIARHASAVLVNSQATAEDLTAYWRQVGLRQPPVTVLPLGLDARSDLSLPVPRPERPYFVMLGTLEARKNHLLILRLWQRLVATDPATAPRLLLIGRRGWENQAVFNLLDRCPELRGHVRECPGLGDAQVQALLRGARALLNPSFAEGYGLPVAEALALGVPVLASDLPAHREVAGTAAEFLDPLDGPAWQQAILDYAQPQSKRRAAALRALRRYRPPQWPSHFEQVLDRLRSLQVAP